MLVNNVRTHDLEYKYENPNDRGVIPKKDLVAQKYDEHGVEIETVDLELLSDNVSAVPNALTLIGDPSKDTERFDFGRMGMERETTISTDGLTLEYKKKELLDDGTIKYYDKDGEIFKIINPDGSVELYGEAIESLVRDHGPGGEEGFWQSVDLQHFNDLYDVHRFGAQRLKLVIDKEGNYTVSTPGGVIYKKDTKGNVTTYDYDGSSETTEEHFYAADGAEKIIKHNKDGSQSLKYEAKADGSYIKYSDGKIWEERTADNNIYQYNSDGTFHKVITSDGVEHNYSYKTYEDGTVYLNVDGSDYTHQYYVNGVLLTDRQANGHEYHYDMDGNVIAHCTYEKSGDTYLEKWYDADGNVIKEFLHNSISPWDYPTIN